MKTNAKNFKIAPNRINNKMKAGRFKSYMLKQNIYPSLADYKI